MIKIGITGGIGSGKSIVSKFLASLSYPVYNSDQEAKRLMVENPLIRKDLVERFGSETYFNGSQLNREYLAKIVFDDREAIENLNAIVHPVVREDIRQWFEKHKVAEMAFVESAILFESHMEQMFDAVWLVSAPIEERIGRIEIRDKSNRASIVERMANQANESYLHTLTPYSILNDNRHPIIPQVLYLIERMRVDGVKKRY